MIPNLEFSNIDKNNYLIHELSNNTQYWVIIAIPPIFEDKGIATRIAISDYKIENIESEKIIIPSGKSAIIYIPSLDYTEDCSLKFCNILTRYSSISKNMRYINSINLDKKFDVLLHNYERMPVFIEKSSNEQSIDIKSFYQRYAFFGAVDTEISKIFNNLHKFMVELKELNYYKLEEYLPLSIRVSSDYYRFYEFINLFFNDIEDDLKIFVDKIYGETELYECIDRLNLTDWSILTTPINNCEDKKSIFNRFLSLKGTKTISGYISPNSYFDIFIELNHNDNKIILSPLFKDSTKSASKYIIKDKEYIIDFFIEHMVKIKPVQNIKVIIFNDINEIVLNAERPTAEIKGNNYTVKSNCDTMIYFYGKLFKNLKQIKIDPNQKGKYIAITSKKSLSCIIDKGFEGYNPLNIEYFLRNPKFKNKIIYIENIYEKMKNNLVKNEGIYLYYFYQKDHKHYYGDEKWPLDDDSYEEFDLKNNSNNYFYNNFLNNENGDIDIAYYDSLCNPNNDYTFTVIPSNSEGKSLIINNRNEREEDKSKIFYQVNFCGDSSNITMFYEYILSSFSPIKYTGMFNFTEDNTYYQGEIYNSIVKVDFKSNEEFVFSFYWY